MEFAKINTTFQPHSIKIGVRVNTWPFRSLSNSLHVVFADNAKMNTGNINPACVNVNDNTDESGSLRWLMVVMYNVSLYPF